MIPKTRFPPPLRPGDRLGITAPSSGVRPNCHARLEQVKDHLRHRGFDPIEGTCLRNEIDEASAGATERANELMDFLTRPDLHAVMPPWGGDRAIELLPRLDFARLREAPVRWMMGYSDISTLLLPLLLRAGWASAHGPQLMDHVPGEHEELTTGAWRLLENGLVAPFEQRSATHHQASWGDYVSNPGVTFSLTEPTQWHPLRPDREVRFEGCLVGGCLDTLMHLVGTPFGDVPGFIAAHEDDGAVLFLENAGLGPTGVLRALTHLRMAGWLDGLRGLMIGRSGYRQHVPDDKVSYRRALEAVLGDLPYPVIVDVDIGHVPPQLTLVLGALATVSREADGRWLVIQRR